LKRLSLSVRAALSRCHVLDAENERSRFAESQLHDPTAMRFIVRVVVDQKDSYSSCSQLGGLSATSKALFGNI